MVLYHARSESQALVRLGIMRAEVDRGGCTGYGPGVLPGETTAACFVIAVANSTATEELRANANWPGMR